MEGTRFIEKFEENVRLYPDRVVMQDETGELSLSQIDILSGRVYAYLKQHGIGREDFVMILLPYSTNIFMAELGVWRAGAAFVIGDTLFAEDRINFVYNDCHCRLKIDAEVWQEILRTAPLSGHEPTDAHDAAFAVYTSGSEGAPKGVIHEYGKLAFIASSLKEIICDVCDTPLSDVIPHFSFVPCSTYGMVSNCLVTIWNLMTTDIGSPALMKNPRRLEEYIERKGLTKAFFPPSYYANYQIDAKCIEAVYMSSEPIQNFYRDNPRLLNIYIQSEGYLICGFHIDRAYKNTPIGKPVSETSVRLYDDEGNVVPDGTPGELCYVNPYFRGYINDEERTRQSFVDGYFRSGDIARKDEQGNYVILGRKSDMIKINGNRIEPAEIEAAVQRILGIEWCAAKGFVQPDRSYICVYYTADVEVDNASMREALLQVLPPYMIPSYFIHINDIPRLPNGKIDRKRLLAPDVEQYRTEYVAPANELEERLCEAMGQVLAINRISVTDDFFLLGGDSLRTIRLASTCGVEGIAASDIYRGRTPRAIAEAWMLKQMEG